MSTLNPFKSSTSKNESHLVSSSGRPAEFSDDDSSDDGGELLSYPNKLSKQVPQSLGKKEQKESGGGIPTNCFVAKVKSYDAITGVTGIVAPRKNTLPKIEIPFVNAGRELLFVKVLKTAWLKFPKENDFITMLQKALSEAVNPYALGLFLATHSGDFLICKQKSMSFSVISELKNWLMKGNLEKMEKDYLDTKLKKVAFEMFTVQKNTSLLKTAFNIFRLDLIRDTLIIRIKDMCSKSRFKDACICATALELHSHFSIDDFVVPLLFQSREAIAEDFLLGSTEKQTEVLKFLDSLVGQRNVFNFIQDYISTHKIPETRMEKLTNKPLFKLLKRLSQKFKANPLTCPNAGRKQRFGALNHLIARKYSNETEMSKESFEEMIDEIVGDDVGLQDEAIYLMRIHDDKKAAAQFAIRLAVPLTKIPEDVLKSMHQLSPNIVPNPLAKTKRLQVPYDDDDWETNTVTPAPAFVPNGTESQKPTHVNAQIMSSNDMDTPSKTQDETASTKGLKSKPPIPSQDQPLRKLKNFYVMPLTEKEIHILVSPDQVRGFLRRLVQLKEIEGPARCIVVGFDAEWKPMFPELPGAALIQIALLNEVYLLDIVSLREHDEKQGTGGREEVNYWSLLKNDFFACDGIIKIAYDIKNDLKMLGATVTEWKNMKNELRACVDLSILEKEIIQKNCGTFFPHDGDSEAGLSELVLMSLGKSLNKEDQFSNWEQRPLRQSQLIYAATDAYCLLDVFKFMVERNQHLSLPFDIDNLIQSQLKVVRVKPSKTYVKKPSIVKCTKEVLKINDAPNRPTSGPSFCNKQLVRDIKFVCDNMLQGLGKKLRACGVDTIILSGWESHDLAIHYAVTEGRFVLTRGVTYDRITDCVPVNQAFRVTSEAVLDQLTETLCYFNIIVTPEDLFSRCQRCNTNTFIHVQGSQMKQMLIDLKINLKRKFAEKEKVLMESPASQECMITCSYPSGGKETVKNWQLLPWHSIDFGENHNIMTTSIQVPIDVNKIPLVFLDCIDNFFICDNCGKCYWESGELEAVPTL